MADFNKALQIHPSSGNNENETENQRNLPPKNKNFMSPTISTASKFTPIPKKKVFSEWKSPNSLPRVPKSVVHSHKNHDNVAVVDDSCDVPYDPLTNYLSPRPRFLRYRPQRRGEIVVKSDGDSLTDSVDTSSTLESENGENGGNGINDEQSVVDENELDEEFEEENWGLKWVFVKFFVVFFGLVYGTMWISCMNSSVPRFESSGGFRIVDEHVMNMSLRIVSLSSLDSGMMGVFESGDKFGKVDRISEVFEVQETNEDDYSNGQAVFDDWSMFLESKTENDKVETEAPVIASEVSEVKINDSEANVSVVIGSGVENIVLDLKTEHEQGEIEAPIEDNVGVIVRSGTEIVVLYSKTEHEQVEIEAPIDASVVNELPGLDGLIVFEVEIHDSEANINYVELGRGVENASEVFDEAIEAEIGKDFRTVQTEYDQVEIIAPVAVQGISELEIIAEEKQSETVNQSEAVESEQFRLTFSELIWPVISPLIAFSLLASLVLKFYCKCKRASSRTRSSYVKLCSTVEKTSKIKPGLPPRALEKTDHSEVRPPSSINPQEHLDVGDIHTIIPRVKQLGEFEVGVEFTQSLKRCSAKTEMDQRDETVFSTPDTKSVALRRSAVSGRASMVQPFCSEVSTADSYSRGRYISQDRPSQKDSKEEVIKATPTPRRSTRLRNKVMTSP